VASVKSVRRAAHDYLPTKAAQAGFVEKHVPFTKKLRFSKKNREKVAILCTSISLDETQVQCYSNFYTVLMPMKNLMFELALNSLQRTNIRLALGSGERISEYIRYEYSPRIFAKPSE